MSPAAEPKRLGKPVDWDELYPGRFLKASDLKGQRVTVTIKSVDLEELEGDGGKMVKGVIGFQGKEKMMTLNRTNGLCLRAMFGKKVQEWEGKRVTLVPTETKFGSETVDAIRIYGSPDIQRDLDIELKLPKKRPVKMTLHRVEVRGGAAPAQQKTADKTDPNAQQSPSVDWVARLSAADTIAKLEAAWLEVGAAFSERPPAELESVFNDRRDELSDMQRGGQLDL